MKVYPTKRQLWGTSYWCVVFEFNEDEYDHDPAWAMHLSGRGLVGGVLLGVTILSDRPTFDSTRSPAGRTITLRATVMPLKKDGSFSVKTEIVDFDATDKRFARLPDRVKDTYKIFSESVDDVLRREQEIDEEERRLRDSLMGDWKNLFISHDKSEGAA